MQRFAVRVKESHVFKCFGCKSLSEVADVLVQSAPRPTMAYSVMGKRA